MGVSNVVKKGKNQTLSISLFHILQGEHLLKQKVVILKIREWKFKGNIARNAIFEGRLGPNFCMIRVKMAKKLITFKNFTLITQS